jgi:Dockerin type I domain
LLSLVDPIHRSDILLSTMKIHWQATLLGLIAVAAASLADVVGSSFDSTVATSAAGTIPTTTNAADATVASLARSRSLTYSNGSQAITFSEFPVGTRISNQYSTLWNKDVVFGPDPATITIDSSTPTSPVLSGVPRFSGPISGYFVDPGSGKNMTIASFNFTAGFFDKVGSTRVTWYDPTGAVLGQVINERNGAETFMITGGNIASFCISVVPDESNGFVIDNFATYHAKSSILFRERSQGAKDGSWGSNDMKLPGFDHVALNVQGSVYESHPGYDKGPVYVAAGGKDRTRVETIAGVQNEHIKGTFKQDSSTAGSTRVVAFEEIAIGEVQAVIMKTAIKTQMGSAGFSSIASIPDDDGTFTSLHPDTQKGRSKSFSGVGLVEWAAERSNLGLDGEGFVPNKLESIMAQDETFPLLSPQLLYYALQHSDIIQGATQFVKGFFFRVDYRVTDPLGRRVGFYNGVQYSEIPATFSTPDGDLEYLIICNPLPGDYMFEIVGNDNAGVAAISVEGGQAIVERNKDNYSTVQVRTVTVPVIAGSRGDVDKNGAIDERDVLKLGQKVEVFTSGFLNPADVNGDGALNVVDVDLLSKCLNKSSILPPYAAPPATPVALGPVKSPRRASPSEPTLAPAAVPMAMLSKSPRRAPPTAGPLLPSVTLSPMIGTPVTSTLPVTVAAPSMVPMAMLSKSPRRAPPTAGPPLPSVTLSPMIGAPMTSTVPVTVAAPSMAPMAMVSKSPRRAPPTAGPPTTLSPMMGAPMTSTPALITSTPSSKSPSLSAPSPGSKTASPKVVPPLRAPVTPPSKAPFIRPSRPSISKVPSPPTATPHYAPDTGCNVVCDKGLFFTYYKMHKSYSVLKDKCVEECVLKSFIGLKQRFGWDCGYCV